MDLLLLKIALVAYLAAAVGFSVHLLSLRPAARRNVAPEPTYLDRVLRASALDIGLAFERTSRFSGRSQEVTRFGLRVGGHIDLPLMPAPPGGEGGELRLRLAVRRMLAFSTPTFPDGTPVPDTRGELFGALAVVF